jgi:hypothetical protein
MRNDRDRELEEQRKDGEAKRTGRDGANPESQPGEFADDVAVNRFTSPPPPAPRREHDH